MTAASSEARQPLLVTIDGPAGVGKSSVARALAKRLGAAFLDTGAMYRAAAALALEAGVDLNDGDAVARLLQEADLRFDFAKDPPELLAHGRSVTHRLRDPDVSQAVSPVSALPQVRQVLVALQRKIASQQPRLVSEGRDQGSIVFPQADVKIYLDATAAERARRRAAQLRSAGRDVDVEAVEAAIRQRDQRDTTRPVGPLIKPPDAVVLDTTGLRFEETIDQLEAIVRRQQAGRRT